MKFETFFNTLSWEDEQESIYRKTESDVLEALNSPNHRDPEKFKALISPAAAPYLEQMAALSRELTLKRFGKVIQMYIPLYVSNECQNICTYCGFSQNNKILRKTLDERELHLEAQSIKKMGYDHVLVVSGEANKTVGVDYFIKSLKILGGYFSQISMEVQPLEQLDYKKLIEEGLHSVFLYQETYRKETYGNYHPAGMKSHFSYRLDGPDRLGRAGAYKIGLGCLIGLEDWRADSFFTAMHLKYLEREYWKTKFSVSFPRLRPFSGSFEPNSVMTDAELVQLICAYRIYNEDVELSLSTREHPSFRNNVLKLGITSMSAGSKTNPGGYQERSDSLEQFEISDERGPGEVAQVIRAQGYEPVWKDWDAVLTR